MHTNYSSTAAVNQASLRVCHGICYCTALRLNRNKSPGQTESRLCPPSLCPCAMIAWLVPGPTKIQIIRRIIMFGFEFCLVSIFLGFLASEIASPLEHSSCSELTCAWYTTATTTSDPRLHQGYSDIVGTWRFVPPATFAARYAHPGKKNTTAQCEADRSPRSMYTKMNNVSC